MKPSTDSRFTVAGRLRSIRFALRGLKLLLRTQHNAWIHLVATVGVIAAGLGLGISRAEWCWIIIAMMLVWTAEALNTALELTCDAVSPAFHPLVGNAKDVAAGAVLVSAVGAAAIGAMVFWPYFF